jgi:hypothetical protein
MNPLVTKTKSFFFHFVLTQSGVKVKDIERQFLRFESRGVRLIWMGAKPWIKMDARSGRVILFCLVTLAVISS